MALIFIERCILSERGGIKKEKEEISGVDRLMQIENEESGKNHKSESAESRSLKRKLYALFDEGLEVLEEHLTTYRGGKHMDSVEIKDEEEEEKDVL